MRIVAVVVALVVVGLAGGPALAEQIEYERPVEAAPTPEDIGGDYVLPEVQRPQPRALWLEVTDVVLLAVALVLASWIVLTRRSRRWIVVLTIACLAYFGFYREGCVCPIGSIQNVTVALTDPDYVIPYVVIITFFLPLVAALFVGRAFCGGVCPLGAIQELVVLKPIQVPKRLDQAFGVLKYVYLGVAIWFVLKPAVDRDFVICRFDPFVGLFRWTGPASMLYLGAGLLLLGIFIGRPYCRWLCPYGVLLSWLSRLSWKGVSITPDRELDCGLCTEACPYGAIEKMRAVRSSCLFCARCYASCPVQRHCEAPEEAAVPAQT